MADNLKTFRKTNMNNPTAPETNAFLSDVADKLESAASNLEAGMNSATAAMGSWSDKYMNANFASKLAYTACYSLSYGVCFPVFMACHYIPKNNSLVEGLVDGAASANASADKTLARFQTGRLQRRDPLTGEFEEVVQDGVGCLEPA